MRLFLSIFFLIAVSNARAQTYFENVLDIGEDIDIGATILHVASNYYMIAQVFEGQQRNWSVVKITSIGDTIWSKQYARTDSMSVYPVSGEAFIHTNDSNFVLVGNRIPLANDASFGFITKLDYNGDTLWYKESVYGTNPISFFNAVIANSDGTYIATGATGTSTNADVWLVKFDANGNVIWQQTFGDLSHQEARSIDYGLISGYILGGYTYANGTRDAYVLKVSDTGAFEWDYIYGNNEADGGWVLASQQNLGYLMYGGVRPEDNPNNEGFYKMLNSDGSVRWSGEHGYGLWSKDWFNTATELESGDFVLAGSSYETDTINNPIGWVMKIDGTDGDVLWDRRYSVRTNDHYFNDVIETSDKGLLLCGYVFPEGVTNTQDAWLLKLDSIGCEIAGGCEPTGIDEQMLNQVQDDLVVYPNPASQELRICHAGPVEASNSIIKIYNSIGQQVYQHFDKLSVTSECLKINVANWQNGIYYVVVGEQKAKIIVAH
jgi:hypothetical protein